MSDTPKEIPLCLADELRHLMTAPGEFELRGMTWLLDNWQAIEAMAIAAKRRESIGFDQRWRMQLRPLYNRMGSCERVCCWKGNRNEGSRLPRSVCVFLLPRRLRQEEKSSFQHEPRGSRNRVLGRTCKELDSPGQERTA